MKTRTELAMRNTIIAFMGQGISLISSFIVRFAFIHTLSATYLGLHGLFSDLLTVFSFADLGIGTAMAYSLYKPLSQNDKRTITSIMSVFKKAYIVIGSFILFIGVLFLPFYRVFMKEIPDIPYLNLIYLLYVINTSISYFYSYRRTLLVSAQKKYKDVLVSASVQICAVMLYLCILYVTKNFILYLCIMISATFFTNFIASKITLKEYPYLTEKAQPLDIKIQKELKKNIGAMVFHKIGGMVRNSTDNLLISKFLGLTVTGIYSNYSMIIHGLTNIIGQIFSSVVSSVGNLHVEKNSEEQKKVFYNIFFLNHWIAAFCSSAVFVLVNHFITLYGGKEYLFSVFITACICLKFYLDMMRKTQWMFCEAAGIYWNGKTKPLWEAAINLVASIILVQYIGIAGIFLGTIISIVFVDFSVEPHLVFKYILKDNPKKYYTKLIIYIFQTVTISGIIYFLCSFFDEMGINGFIIKVFVCIFALNILILFYNVKNDNLKFAINIIKMTIKKLHKIQRNNK